jgi:hypothetical protein
MFGYPRTGWRTRPSALLLVLTAFTLLAAGCTAATTDGPREDPKATRAAAIRPPLTLDGVLTTSETLGTLPEGWWADGTSDFRDRHAGLGIALQYKSESAWATFYIYDFGEEDIVGKGEDARIEAVAKQALREILSSYRNVKPGALVVVPLCGGSGIRISALVDDGGSPRATYLYQSSVPGFFVKARISVLPKGHAPVVEDLDAMVDSRCRALLEQFGPRPKGKDGLML